ncbi:hypothetical protein WANA34_0285 [Wolbachia endosymbiont of Drosophila ananassae]|nr:hypothetical protein WANA34_0285 [Wolbachia endosymbiont of Drosophila ananassae]
MEMTLDNLKEMNNTLEIGEEIFHNYSKMILYLLLGVD